MAKKGKAKAVNKSAVDTGRGVIKHNALAALVTSKVFKPQVVKAKKGKGPTLIEAISYRLSDHTTADDATRYRSSDELKEAWQFDPVTRMKAYMIKQKIWSEEQDQDWLEQCKEKVEVAVSHYMQLTNPAPESAFDFLYESTDPELNKQRDELINKAMRMQGQGQGQGDDNG